MKRFCTKTRGAALLEYSVLIGILVAGSIGTVALFGEDIAEIYRRSASDVGYRQTLASEPSLGFEIDFPDGGGETTPPRPDPEGEVGTDPDETQEDDKSEETSEFIPNRPDCRFGPVFAAPPNYVDGDIVLLQFNGNQIGRYESMWGHGNQKDRIVYVNGLVPLGPKEEIFTLRVWQTFGNTEIKNGMLADVLDPDGQLVAGYFNLKPDEEQRLATGDEHMILTPIRMVIDLNGLEEGDTIYGYDDEIGDPDWGDNDGEFDFDQTGCQR